MTAPKYTAFVTYQTFMAMKMHFDSSNNYDFIKYNGKFHAKEYTFRKRKDSKMFFQLSAKVPAKRLIHYLLAGFSTHDNPWIGTFVESHMDEIYKHWKNRIQYLEGHYQYQLKYLLEQNDSKMFQTKESTTPSVFHYYLDGKISLETLLLLNKILNIFHHVHENMGDVVEYTFIPELEYKITQYERFFNLEKEQYKLITQNTIRSMQ